MPPGTPAVRRATPLRDITYKANEHGSGAVLADGVDREFGGELGPIGTETAETSIRRPMDRSLPFCRKSAIASVCALRNLGGIINSARRSPTTAFLVRPKISWRPG